MVNEWLFALCAACFTKSNISQAYTPHSIPLSLCLFLSVSGFFSPFPSFSICLSVSVLSLSPAHTYLSVGLVSHTSLDAHRAEAIHHLKRSARPYNPTRSAEGTLALSPRTLRKMPVPNPFNCMCGIHGRAKRNSSCI